MGRMFALSLKQPWAALLAHGLKTIEVRRWKPTRHGHILIHAARVRDERPEAWARVPPEVLPATQLMGGIVGAGDLSFNYVSYRSLDAFTADQGRHLNEPAWFEEPVLYGFVFSNLRVLPYRRYPGWMRFFKVEDQAPRQQSGTAANE
jgi:ASCH domain-containing protein